MPVKVMNIKPTFVLLFMAFAFNVEAVVVHLRDSFPCYILTVAGVPNQHIKAGTTAAV